MGAVWDRRGSEDCTGVAASDYRRRCSATEQYSGIRGVCEYGAEHAVYRSVHQSGRQLGSQRQRGWICALWSGGGWDGRGGEVLFGLRREVGWRNEGGETGKDF